MDFEQARINMIEQQIRPWEVLDQHTLDLIAEIHREDFIPDTYKSLSLADTGIPLMHGQVTMTPKVEARLMQSLEIQKGDKILEIGTGCGYLTALLASAGDSVLSVDIFPEFIEQAGPKFDQHGLTNIELKTLDALDGWQPQDRYDAIAVTGSVPMLGNHFHRMLKNNGRLFIIVGQAPVMEARLITRIDERQWSCEVLFETVLPALIGADGQKRFKF